MKRKSLIGFLFFFAVLVFWLLSINGNHKDSSELGSKAIDAKDNTVVTAASGKSKEDLSKKSEQKPAQTTSLDNEPTILENETRLKRWTQFNVKSNIPLDESNIDMDREQRATLSIDMFGEKVIIDRYEEHVTDTGVFVWTGKSIDNEDSLVSISIKDGVVAAEFNLVSRFFSIRHDEKAGNILMEIDLSKALPKGNCTIELPLRNNQTPKFEPSKTDDNASLDQNKTSSQVQRISELLISRAFAQAVPDRTVTVMVLARSGVANVNVLATNLVSYTNTALRFSGAKINIQLVYAGNDPQVHPGDDEGIYPQNTPLFKSRMKQYMPDRVIFLTPRCSTAACGMASGYRGIASGQWYTVIFTGWASASGSSSVYFAHELGHTLGGHHDPANYVAGSAILSYARGFLRSDGTTGTMMSYARNRLPRYSHNSSGYGNAGQRNVDAFNTYRNEVSLANPPRFVHSSANPVFKNQAVYSGKSLSITPPRITTAIWIQGNTSLSAEDGASYTWQLNGTTISNGWGISLPRISAASAGTYSVTANHDFGPPLRSSFVLTVIPFPVITVTKNPVVVGGSATLTVGTNGTAYQWFRNGIAVAAAVGKSLTISNVQASHSGTYTVRVTSAAGVATSGGLALVVNSPSVPAPVISSHPESRTVSIGSNASFSGTASGTSLSYQWLKNGVVISGATAATYSISTAQTSDAGSYSLRVSNISGSVTSRAATLTVSTDVRPSINTQPVARNVYIGQSTSLSVSAAGSGRLTYQWLKNLIAIPGATSSTISFLNIQKADEGDYTVRVTNSIGYVASNIARVSVIGAPVITTQPASRVAIVGDSVSFTVVATGGSSLTYQWLKNGALISGATSTIFMVNNVQKSHQGIYSVRVTNPSGSVTSNSAELRIGGVPVISVQPIGIARKNYEEASLSVIADGAPPLTYQWYRNGIAIPGQVSRTIDLDAVMEIAGEYSVKVSNSLGEVTSDSAVFGIIYYDPPKAGTEVEIGLEAGDISFTGGL